METDAITIVKRDGSRQPFSLNKIVRAIEKAYRAGGMIEELTVIEQTAERVAQQITAPEGNGRAGTRLGRTGVDACQS